VSKTVAKVSIRDGDGVETELTLEQGGTIQIGRSEGNEYRIFSSKASRFHAAIRSTPEGVIVQDLGSLNGTFINGKLIGASSPVRTGDRMTVAGCDFLFAIIENLQPEFQSDETKPVELQAYRGTILVSDIRGYSRLSEALPAKELTAVLRIWSERVSQVIQLLDGTVDKFIGDSVLAHWLRKSSDTGESLEILAEKAYAASKRIEAETLALESSVLWPFAPKHRWRVKSSLASGEVIFGNMGRGDARSFSVFGDAVNRVFRLNDLCSEVNRHFLCDEVTATLAGGSAKFSFLQESKLEGKDERVKVYTIE